MKELISRNAEVARRYGEGETQSALADAYGVTRGRISQILKRAGVITRQPEPRHGNPELRRAVIDLRKGGVSPAEITKRLAISRGQALGILWRAGLCAKSEAA